MPANDDVPDRARRALVVAAVATAVVPLVPFASVLLRPFVWLQTFAHESGHGLSSLLIGAHTFSLRVYADGSGVTSWTGGASSPLTSAFTAAGGLVGPAIAAAFFFAAARRRLASRIALGALAIVSLAAVVLVVDNVFGKIAVLAWSFAFALAAWKLDAAKAQVACAFAGVDLGLSVFSRGDYLFTATAHTAEGESASDVAQVAAGLGGFFWAWGALIGAVSVVIVAAGLFLLVRRGSR